MFTKTKIQEIHFTKDYGMFKILQGNRDKYRNAAYIRLKLSIEKKHIQSSAIIVNEHMEIIDGQHRFWVCQELGFEVPYTIEVGATRDDAQLLNTAGRYWNIYDHLDAYADNGIKDYQTTLNFIDKYGFNMDQSMALLSNTTTTTGDMRYKFREGSFKVKDLKLANKQAGDMLSFESLYNGVRRRSFVYAMLSCFSIPEFDIKRLRSKLAYQKNKLSEVNTKDGCLKELQAIYNYNSTDDKRLRLISDL